MSTSIRSGSQMKTETEQKQCFPRASINGRVRPAKDIPRHAKDRPNPNSDGKWGHGNARNQVKPLGDGNSLFLLAGPRPTA